MTTKLFGKDLKEYEDIDIDKLLEGLTPEQLEDLNYELDPDVSIYILSISMASSAEMNCYFVIQNYYSVTTPQMDVSCEWSVLFLKYVKLKKTKFIR